MKKIIIAGGSGYIGKLLSNFFLKDGYQIVILTRGKSQLKNSVKYVGWHANWQTELESAEAIINLTGKSINCRFTTKNKAIILQSRLDATAKINRAILACKNPPKVFINASGASIYKCSFDTVYNEYNEVFGSSFLADVCKKWEGEFYKTETFKTRKVAIRITPVLGKESHAIKPLKKIVALGLGGKQGSGKQYFSWIHERDFAKAIAFIIANKQLVGSINLTAPTTITNASFMQTFRKVMRISIGIPTPTFLLHLSKYITGVEPDLILDSLRIAPKKLLDAGFIFEMDTMEKALLEMGFASKSRG